MPGFNGTGPMGQGAGTGGRRGPCFAGAGTGAGAAGQRGAGRGYAPRGGRRPGFGGQWPADESAQALKDRAAALERELEEVRRLIDDRSVK